MKKFLLLFLLTSFFIKELYANCGDSSLGRFTCDSDNILLEFDHDNVYNARTYKYIYPLNFNQNNRNYRNNTTYRFDTVYDAKIIGHPSCSNDFAFFESRVTEFHSPILQLNSSQYRYKQVVARYPAENFVAYYARPGVMPDLIANLELIGIEDNGRERVLDRKSVNITQRVGGGPGDMRGYTLRGHYNPHTYYVTNYSDQEYATLNAYVYNKNINKFKLRVYDINKFARYFRTSCLGMMGYWNDFGQDRLNPMPHMTLSIVGVGVEY
jgi:hypothetical protein